jgi:hypothetical protein
MIPAAESLPMIRPILVLEINEVPWRLIDRFKNEPRFSNIRKFFQGSKTYTTHAVDSGELSPWVTWPSFHRGMANTEHGINYLGQDPATYKGTPIWEEYRRRGLPIGVCGSLQSWPPQDPGESGFYIPDTFAHDERCIPAFVEPFQKFNLGQVSANPRIVNSGSLFTKDLVPLVMSLPRLGITPRTMAMLAKQLVKERLDATYLSRRPIFQSILLWDVFKTLYKPDRPPAFSTFFTNHVAGVMHRYWHNVFPEDFGDRYAGKPQPYRATMIFALELVDRMLGDAMTYQRKNPDLVLVFATSMGQQAIIRDGHQGVEVTLMVADKLMQVCGFEPTEYLELLAMAPQVAIHIQDPARRLELTALLENARAKSGTKLFKIDGVADTLSITFLSPSAEDVAAGRFTIANRQVTWEEAGMKVHETDPGTAYHVPEGVLAVHGAGQAAADTRESLSAREAKSFLIGLGGLN